MNAPVNLDDRPSEMSMIKVLKDGECPSHYLAKGQQRPIKTEWAVDLAERGIVEIVGEMTRGEYRDWENSEMMAIQTDLSKKTRKELAAQKRVEAAKAEAEAVK